MKAIKSHDKDRKNQHASKENNNNKINTGKVIPLMPDNSPTLADKITVTSDNEDILTLVKDDKNDY